HELKDLQIQLSMMVQLLQYWIILKLNFGCIIGSTLSTESTRVSIYEDIHQVVDMIKSCNAIASQIPIPKFPPYVIAIIANQGKKTARAPTFIT
ncbi:4900_t:CDS:2, partial [Gigaspora margarita]